MTIRAVLTDIDGTLAPQAGKFSAAPQEGLRKINEKIILGFSTGKNFDHVYGICRALGIDTRFVSSENGVISHWLTNKIDPPAWDVFLEVPTDELESLHRFAELTMLNSALGIFRMNGEIKKYRPELKRGVQTLFPIKNLSETEPYFSYFKEIIEKNNLQLRAIYNPDGAIDIVPLSISKVNGLNRFAELTGIPKNEILIAVDGGNDRELARASEGPIICPANAKDEIKEIVTKKGGYIATQKEGEGFLEGLAHYNLL